MTERRADRSLRHRPPPITRYVARSFLEAGGFRLRLHLAVAGGTFTGMAAKVQEQNLAVFGEGGSGKTVLLSSFYGASQEPSFLAESLYKVLADDTGQGMRLLQNYLRMRNQAKTPAANR